MRLDHLLSKEKRSARIDAQGSLERSELCKPGDAQAFLFVKRDEAKAARRRVQSERDTEKVARRESAACNPGQTSGVSFVV